MDAKTNKLLNKHELDNQTAIKKEGKDIKEAYLYPHLDDADFNRKIADKREFYDTQYDGAILDIPTYADELAEKSFELAPHQIFVKNFLSFYTPYNSLLLYHGLGSGKTCSAIGVCEERRQYMKRMNIPLSKIYIVASPFVQENFQLQLFNRSKLKVSKSGMCSYDGCVGNELLNEINPGRVPYQGTERDIKDYVEKEIKKVIAGSYLFMGYEKFSNLIESKIKSVKDGDAKSVFFNNRLIVIDEIHNIRKQGSSISENLITMLQNSQNTQLLLLTATPMFNHYTEIIWLVNLLNVNDKRGIITIGDVFNDNGEFKRGGKELLMRKMRGYISYVRGENPYTFPFRIYPNIFAPRHTFSYIAYPTHKPNGVIIGDPKIYLKPYLTNMEGEQMATYRRIINHQLFYKKTIYTIDTISKCIQCSIIVYPTAKQDELFYDADSDIDDVDAIVDVDAVVDDKEEEQELFIEFDATKDAQQIIDDDDKPKNGRDEYEEMEYDKDEKKDQAYIKKYISKKILADAVKQDGTIDNIGENGLRKIMNYTRTNVEIGNFEYKPQQPKIFQLDNLKEYSSKMHAIGSILDEGVEGIVLIYSKYIFSGIVPMALVLEEMGFNNASSRGNLMKKTGQSRKKSPYSYIMITGTPLLTPDFKIINKLNHADNINGDKIKVVLISDSGSEGIDLQMVRQIHILDPWFNLNRIEQIVGRGVRNFSHRRLPFDKRNVEIFLHASMLTDRPNEEAMDLYQYRHAEKKAIDIGKVARIIKQNAIDCILNNAQTNFTEDNFSDQKLTIQLADGQIVRDYAVGDKPHTASCDYMDTCEYECSPQQLKTAKINDTTYNVHFSQTNIGKIVALVLMLFQDRFFYEKGDLIAFVNNSHQTFPVHLIDLALTYIMDNEMVLVDKYGRHGTMVNIGDYYLYQPKEINVKNLSIQDRSMKLNVNYDVIAVKNIVPIETQKQVPRKQQLMSVKSVGIDEIGEKEPIEKDQELFIALFEKYDRIQFLSQQVPTSNAKKTEMHTLGEVIMFLSQGDTSKTTTNLDWMKLVIRHLFDMLSMEEKLEVMNYVQTNKIENIEFDVRNKIKTSLFFTEIIQYIQSFTFDYRGKKMVYFITDPILKKVDLEQVDGTYFQLNSQKIWEALPNTLNNELNSTRNNIFKINATKRTIGGLSLENKVGFIGFHNSKTNIVFKMKNVEKIKKTDANQVLKGTNCFQATPQDILKDLDWLSTASNNLLFSKDAVVAKKQSKTWMCLLLEFSLRRLNELRVNDKIWFVSTPEAVQFKF